MGSSPANIVRFNIDKLKSCYIESCMSTITYPFRFTIRPCQFETVKSPKHRRVLVRIILPPQLKTKKAKLQRACKSFRAIH